MAGEGEEGQQGAVSETSAAAPQMVPDAQSAVGTLSIEAAMSKWFDEARRQRFERVDRLALAWLAVAPIWTDTLASVVRFPTGPDSPPTPEGLEALINRAESTDLVTVERAHPHADEGRLRLKILSVLAKVGGDAFVLRALLEVQAVQNAAVRAGALADFAGAVGPETLEAALRIARGLEPPATRARAMAALARTSPPERREKLVDEVIGDLDSLPPVERATVIAAIAPAVSEARRTKLVKEALRVANTVDDDFDRAGLLVGLAPVIGSSLGAAFVKVSEEIRDPNARASVLAAASPVLSPALVRRIRAAFGETTPGALDLEIGDIELAAATVERDPAAINSAIATARALTDPVTRAGTLAALAVAVVENQPDLSAELAKEATDLFAASGDPRRAVMLGSRIADLLAAVEQRETGSALLRSGASYVPSEGAGIEWVGPLIRLAEAYRSTGDDESAATTALTALKLADHLDDAKGRVAAVVALIPLLPADDGRAARGRAHDTLLSALDPGTQAELLVILSAELDPAEVSKLAASILERANATGGDFTFWMPDAVRNDALEYLTTGTPPIDLQAVAADIGTRLSGAISDRFAVPAPLARWAALAREVDTPDRTAAMVRNFSEQIQSALALGDITTASSLIAAGTALAPVVGSQMDTAVRLANRRLALVFRTTQDRRHLQKYLERAEQTRALDDLLGERGTAWALHFLGMGGVGKTMLIRFLTAEVAPRAGYATARVDFDYMSADYPVFRPGQLFLELMGELETYATSTAAGEYVRRVEDSIVRLHEELSTKAKPEKPLAGLRSPAFDDVLVAFRDLLWQLDRPVLLILDTCEELAKIQSPDSTLPSVMATFEILERLRENGPPIKVVFAGRRLLARAGDGWQAGDVVAGEARALLPDRKDYLRLQEILPFTEDEARRFLTDITRLSLDAATLNRILELSDDTGTAAAIEWDVDRRMPEQSRYNPFDLSLYAEWASEMTDPTPDQLGGVDQGLYVERRILGRIGSEDVRGLVAPAVLLRRFDRQMLRPAFHGNDDAFEKAFQELSAQEWIDLQRDEERDLSFLLVDEHLYGRLRRYFDDARRSSEFASVKRRLAPGLRDGLLSLTFNELTVDYISAALRLLPSAEASAAWDAISQRVVKEGRWDWADRITARLLADEDAAGRVDSPLRAAVAALQASSLLHLSPASTATSTWEIVATSLANERDPEIREWLTIRRAASLLARGSGTTAERALVIAALRDPAKGWTRSVLQPEHRSLEVAATLYGVIDSIVEQLEGSAVDTEGLTDALVEYSRWLRRNDAPTELTAMASLAAARALAIVGRTQESRDEVATVPAGGVTSSRAWLDWLPPANLEDAIRLEQLRLDPILETRRTDDELRAWIATALPRLSAIDSERLASAALRTLLSRALVSVDVLDEAERNDAYEPDRRPTRYAHREVDPLFVTIALGRLALGNAEGAIAGLEARVNASSATGTDDATRHATDAAKACIARRMRLPERLSTAVDRLANSDEEADLAAALPAIALTRGPSSGLREGISTLYPHLWRRTRTVRAAQDWSTPEFMNPAAQPLIESLLPTSSFEDTSLAFDNYESDLMLVVAGLSSIRMVSRETSKPVVPTFSISAWAERHPSQVEQAARLALRSVALGIREPGASSSSQVPGNAFSSALATYEGRVGTRRIAELALDEGELLALRLPAYARVLLYYARVQFAAANDSFGALIATACEAVATVRAAPSARPEPQLAQTLADAYQAVESSDGVPQLPKWSAVELAASGHWADLLPWIERDPWGQWVLRIYLVLTWAAGRHDVLPPSVKAIPPSARPVELVGTESDQQSSGGSGGSGGSAAPRGLGLVPLPLVGIGVIVGVLALIVVVLGWFLPGSTVIERLFLIGVLIVVLVVLAASASPIRRVGTSSLVARSPISLSVGEVEREGKATGSPQSRAQFELLQLLVTSIPETPSMRNVLGGYADSLLARFGIAKPHPERQSGNVRLVKVGGPYSPVGPRLPGDVVDRLRWTQARLSRHRLPLALDIAEQSLGGAPWDALVTLAAEPKMRRPSDCHLDPYRRGAPIQAGRSRSRRMRVTAVVDRSSSALVARGWGANSWGAISEVTALRSAAGIVPDATDILHIVGRPIETSGGVMLQVAGREGQTASKTVEQRVRGMSLDSGGVRPETLPVSGIPLVIVQGEPVEATSRAESDRVQAASLRAASDLIFRGGARTVIMIPALPPALAEEVLLLLARRLGPLTRFAAIRDRLPRILRARPPRYDLHGPVDAVLEARDLIAARSTRGRGESPDHAAQLELALDLTIFARAPRESQ